MSDIFISYAREDRDRVEPIAQALIAQHWSVWWDREIPYGRAFDEVIEEELTSARCVVVAWSTRSVKRDWVKEEAREGHKRGILVPVRIDEVEPPLGFRRLQTADLIGWDGKQMSPKFRDLAAGIARTLAATAVVVAREAPTVSASTGAPPVGTGDHPVRRILVAGTGTRTRTRKLPPNVEWSARAVGEAIAQAGYGLVGGGWRGVDYVTAEAFSQVLKRSKRPLSRFLTQVVAQDPEFRGGNILYVEHGPNEWLKMFNHADAVVLIGGVGGTYITYLHAIQEQIPVFPLAATGHDAKTAFEDILKNWDSLPVSQLSKSAFESVLSQEIRTPTDADRTAKDVMRLIGQYFGRTERQS